MINPFQTPTPLARKRLLEVIDAAGLTYKRGWNDATGGNFSVLDRHQVMWQSPSGVAKGFMKLSGFIAIDILTLKALHPEAPKPSDETPLHAAIYRRFPEAKVVMHVHAPRLVSLSQTQSELEFYGQEMIKVFGSNTHEALLKIPIFPNTQDMVALGKEFLTLPLTAPVFILAGHGVYTWGKSAHSALKNLEGIEYLCMTRSNTSP